MAGEISLSAAVRSSLLSLSGTENLISRTQGRLSSGLRVSSPIDDAKIFFEAKALNDRASDFDEKKDGIDQGISSLSTALEAVESIDSLVQQLKGLANAAKSGLNLINGTGQTLDVEFSTTTTSLISVASVDLTTGTLGLDITSVASLTVTSTLTTKIDDAIAELDTALSTLRANAQELGGNVALLQTRLDFTESYVNVLEEGSAKLTLANITEEGANLVALQTRQQLGISALAFAGQSEQGVLALFR
jgi:flagellin-like hook-associated protein FlgL